MKKAINVDRRQRLRIAIVDDTEIARVALRHIVESHAEWQLTWVAHDGDEAVRRCAQDMPDLILMDLIMPGKNGAVATREIMASTPCAILIVTAGFDTHLALIFEALAAGALDAVALPMNLETDGQKALVAKIRTISKLIDWPPDGQTGTKISETAGKWPALVAIGASAGGPAALRLLLMQLPAEFPAAVVIIQHIDEKYAAGMAEWLSSDNRLPVTVAKAGGRPEAGRILLAGTNDHLVLQKTGSLAYTTDPVSLPYRPSIDEFFFSAARNWCGPIVGVLLTGMGQDGARGLQALHRLGHFTFAQDRESAIVYGMPGTAVRLKAVTAQMSPTEIGKKLARMILDLPTAEGEQRKNDRWMI